MAQKKIAVLWKQGPVKGVVDVIHGKPVALKKRSGSGKVKKSTFAGVANQAFGLEFTVKEACIGLGANQTRVSIKTDRNPFSFFLRDVNRKTPIFISAYGIIVTEADDKRSYDEIQAEIQALGLHTQMQQIEAEPEETYEDAAARNKEQVGPIWLGLSRDMRIFELIHEESAGYWGRIQPRYHTTPQNIPETNGAPYSIDFAVGPGSSCREQITRRLEDGVLPILHSVQKEDGVDYHLSAFVTLESRPVTQENLRGSEGRVVYPHTGGNMLSAEERADIQREIGDHEMWGRDEETVCCIRVKAVNSSRTPRYAWFKGPYLKRPRFDTRHNRKKGFTCLPSGRVLGVNRLNGKPMPESEVAVLIQPGETAVLDMLIPHQPISQRRADKLRALDYNQHLQACRLFWKSKLDLAASISVPEKAVDERIRAGLLHLDIAALGKEPDGDVLATIGWYAPIGSESAPIIQFFDSMGWHSLARRSLNFFLNRQQEDGFIQNFGGYQLETGPVLWTVGEHYRYTRDKRWIKRIKPKLLLACKFLLDWRNRNKKKSLRGMGYGMQDGKVADPEDFFHSFMLNSLSYIGIKRTAEVLSEIDPPESRRLKKEAAAYAKDIRTAFYESLARSPVIPLRDGTWIPTVAPWAEYPGPVSLFAEGGSWFTHGAFGARDSLIGPLYLTIAEILEPNEIGTEFLLQSHQELFTVQNAGLTQPYYCRHDYGHLMRGEVKAFLKTYYNQFTSLQDRETYSFWEHYFHASPHKTHEEGWFLMQTRWMLWKEDGDTLRLLPGVPRDWLKHGQAIELREAASYFGKISLNVESRLADNRICARITCPGSRQPKKIVIRLPHPEYRKAIAVTGGSYDPETECITITGPKNRADVSLTFA